MAKRIVSDVFTSRNSRGTLQTVTIPMVTESDPEWYQRAALAAGLGPHSVYTLRADRFLTLGSAQAKIGKSDAAAQGYLSAILHHAPHKLSGKQVCASARACRWVCINGNGNGQMRNEAQTDSALVTDKLMAQATVALAHHVHQSRIAKTRLYFIAPELWAECLEISVTRFAKRANRQNLIPLIRPNGTSDLPYESKRFQRFGNLTIFERFVGCQWYDYTKLFPRARAFGQGMLPDNYDLTFSRDEQNHAQTIKVLEFGGRVACVIRTPEMRGSWGGPLAKLGKLAIKRAIKNGIPGYEGFPVVSGDDTDLRHLDPKGSIVALYAKGRAAADDSGFVVELN